MSEALLEMRNISKAFGGVKALEDVRLTLRAGEIHALMGENGAGKSTLIKVLTGVHARDGGSIEFDGRAISPRSPKEAEAHGISTVYQEVNLIPTLSVAENIMLGRQPKRFGIIRWKAMRAQAGRALARLGLDLDVTRELRSCSIAVQQMVAIARALDVQAKLLILDEQECAALFDVMRRLRGEGLAILFVTHFLDQVYAVTDRITVLRNGGFVGTFETSELPRLDLIGKMLGRELKEDARATKTVAGRAPGDARESSVPVLEARALGRRGAMHPIDLRIGEGEVVGLAGLLGSGRTETARMLFGADRPNSGEIRVRGEVVSLASPRKAIRRGLAFCSEDRKAEGIIPNLSVRENLVLALQASRGPARLLPRAEQMRIAEHYIRLLDIRTPGAEAPIRNLSGGNQQKVLLARWLALQPRLIILDEPTRGIDVGAKAEIEKLVASLREKGMSVLFISSELEEVVRVSQRVIVLRDRRKAGELGGDEVNEHSIMNLIAGHGTDNDVEPRGA